MKGGGDGVKMVKEERKKKKKRQGKKDTLNGTDAVNTA
jgi:hypothetical protein